MADPVTPEDVSKAKDQVDEQVAEAGRKAKEDAEAKGASPEEVTAAIEKARKEEKDKLYPQLKELKEGFAALQKVFEEERAEKVQMKKDAEQKAEDERKSKLSDQERTNEVLLRLEEQLKSERLELSKFKQQLEKRDRADEIRRYKEKLIQANKDTIIPEIVHGTTVEELDESLEIAKARFKELEEEITQRLGNETRKKMPRSTNPDYEALEELEISKDLTAIDQDKYLKDDTYRKQIQAELENEYMRMAGRR